MTAREEREKTKGKSCIEEELIQGEALTSYHMVMRDLLGGDAELIAKLKASVALEYLRYVPMSPELYSTRTNTIATAIKERDDTT